MKSTKSLAALGAALLVVVLAAVGTALGHLWVGVLGLGLLLVAQFAVVLDTNRRARYLPRVVKGLLRDALHGAAMAPTVHPTAAVDAEVSTPSETRPHTSEGDQAQQELKGAIRLIQAQYMGRLDRAQTALESAAEDLRSVRDDR